MRSRLPGTIAGARADGGSIARPIRALPAPRRIHHTRNLVWWVVLVALGLAAYFAETKLTDSGDGLVLPTGHEREAFLAVTFGKIAEEGTDTIPAAAFREQ